MWKPGDRLTHRHNPDLGPGRVVSVSGRRLLVQFPETGKALRFAADSDALVALNLGPGSRARLETSGEIVTIEAAAGEGRFRLADGREVEAEKLWPAADEVSPVEELARGRVGAAEDFRNRLDAMRLTGLRVAGGLGSFLGGRIQLYPHQLYAAERACGSDPVRWLLADEVGLGKTVEACLVMNRLIQTGRAERILVVAPETLTVQWLGELWRKYHQVFVLVDDQRRGDVVREYGEGFNPFEVYRRAIVSLEALAAEPELARQAADAGVDLVVVDEAHRLQRPPQHPGKPAYRAVATLAALGRHLLLLTATPLEDDAHGFFRLLQLLRPDEFPEGVSFARRLEDRRPLPPCTSVTRRADIGGLPPRVAVAVDVDAEGWRPLRRLEERVRLLPADTAGARRRRIRRALASPSAVAAVLPKDDADLRAVVAAARDADPRVLWLTAQAQRWRRTREKTLVFVAHRETLDLLRDAVERRGRVQVGIFHEGLTPERRDLEVARFRLAEGPAVLISTECGGEGRNFEFCRRLVLFDLPWNPSVVEQRIGRLDRIGRTQPTEIVYFRPPDGFGRALVELYERLGIFREPLGGLERELREVAREVERVAMTESGAADPRVFDGILGRARKARDKVREAAYHELHREPYHRDMAAAILARIPPELDRLNEQVVLLAAERLGLEVEERRGVRTWLIELGAQALVDNLPGVPGGTRFLGTFDRQQAVADETLDYFAAGHPLVEGILAELEESPRGRTALLKRTGEEEEFGLLALYRDGAGLRAVALDRRGRQRPDLARELVAPRQVGATATGEPVEAFRWLRQPGWKRGIRRLGAALEEPPEAVAAFRIRHRRGAQR